MKELFDPSNQVSYNHKFRVKRFEHFKNFIDNHHLNKGPISILDIGGTQDYWHKMDFFQLYPQVKITLVNLGTEHVEHPNLTSMAGDACNLFQFQDKSFDIVFSNSVIEHLFSWENQQKMASEVLRIGRHYYIQTPNKYFPIEPHWMTPFYQFLPRGVKIQLTKNLNLGHYPKTATIEEAKKRVDEVKLLSSKEMKSLFPSAAQYQEKLMGFIKSITAFDDFA
jgi:predicted SAM-dependent methyltransferase